MAWFKRTPTPERYEKGRVYDYTTPEGRVATAEWLFEQAKNERAAIEGMWRKYNDYYNFNHEAARDKVEALKTQFMSSFCCELDPIVASVPDPYIMVESQIDPDVPQPEFHGRDDDQDSEKAKQRALAVRYIMEENRISDMNTSNERRLRKLGDAFWKAYWDETMPCGNRQGNIRICDVAPQDIYPDPTAGPAGLQACEYLFYVYSMHKLKFWRLYHEELTKRGLTLDAFASREYREAGDILEPYTRSTDSGDDVVQVMEFWYRQPFDAKGIRAGTVGCSIQAGGVELRNIPNYWQKTGGQNDRFPFVHYWCIRDETQFWNRSELEPILPLVDAADRELINGLFNDEMQSNDLMVAEDNAVYNREDALRPHDGVIWVTTGGINKIRRLGGLNNGINSVGMIEWLLTQAQRANRNYDNNNGRETARITTASGLLQLRSDAQQQNKIKTADRNAGFCRLFELLDALALEFFDDDRLLFIGAKNAGEDARSIIYNSANYALTSPALRDPASGEIIREAQTYFPRVDVTVTCGDGIGKTPGATVEILDKIAATAVTPDNWKLIAAMLEYLDIPQKQDIIRDWSEKFEPVIPPEVTAELEKNPELLSAVSRIVESLGAQEQFPQNPGPAPEAAAMVQPAPVGLGEIAAQQSGVPGTETLP